MIDKHRKLFTYLHFTTIIGTCNPIEAEEGEIVSTIKTIIFIFTCDADLFPDDKSVEFLFPEKVQLLSTRRVHQYSGEGKFKSGIEKFSDNFKPLSPQELTELLKAKDHENEVKDVENLSEETLNSLLDRSDLYAKWKNQDQANIEQKQKAKGKKPKKQQKTKDVCSVFSVIDEEV